jgi:hypothetical protein
MSSVSVQNLDVASALARAALLYRTGKFETPCRELKHAIKVGTQSGTQKCAERAVEAVDAVHAVRIFPRKFSAC